MKLRAAGLDYREISDALGISESYARALVKKELDRAKEISLEQAEQIIAIELQRLDAMHASLWEQRGDPKASEALLKIGKARRDLLGLDAPTRREVSGPDGGPLELSVAKMSTEELLDLLDESTPDKLDA
jgi:hypothetical protein